MESPLHFAMEKERNTTKIYTSKRPRQNQSTARTPTKDRRQTADKVGYMPAIEEDGKRFIGKVTSIGRTTVQMVLYTGMLRGVWNPTESAQGIDRSQIFSKEKVKDDMLFYLTGANNFLYLSETNRMV